MGDLILCIRKIAAFSSKGSTMSSTVTNNIELPHLEQVYSASRSLRFMIFGVLEHKQEIFIFYTTILKEVTRLFFQ